MICITPRAFALETAPLLKPLSCQAIACASDEETPSSDATWPICEPLTWLAVGLGAATGTTRRAGAGAVALALTAAQAKLKSGRLAVHAADEAVQVHGGYGYIEEYPVCRFYRDAKILTIGEGTDEVQQMVIARALGA